MQRTEELFRRARPVSAGGCAWLIGLGLKIFLWQLVAAVVRSVCATAADSASLKPVGLAVVPHVQSSVMQYRRAPDPDLGFLASVFLVNSGSEPLRIDESLPVRFRGKSPKELLAEQEWTWHDTPAAWEGRSLSLPPGALTVWNFNTRGPGWGPGSEAEVGIGPAPGMPEQQFRLSFAAPETFVSAIAFLGRTNAVRPEAMIFHVRNDSPDPLRLVSCRLWLPAGNDSWRALLPGAELTNLHCFPMDGTIPPGDCGGARVDTGPLPLSYAAVEIQVTVRAQKASPGAGGPRSLWAWLRVKRESFDISGGWVGAQLGASNTLQFEPYLKTLRRMHVDTGHIADSPGYTDQTGPDGLYARYPLKYFNKLEPLSHYDSEALLPRIHAVEFLGEPQYGGGRPVPPMEVWQKLAPYQATRLPTTVTHSEERIWRYYAGLSDFPHYDAYRVSAPAADAWGKYDRWSGQRIRWGAPLETIGELCRSLRELNRPRPVACWSQGAHAGWDRYDGRRRTSPNPDELRLQAYHALASRIASLYWFNLSLKSLVKFPDLIEPITKVGREIRMVEDVYLEGAAYRSEVVRRGDKPDWELASITGPQGALLFALDLDYAPDPKEKEFVFGPARPVAFRFPLPAYLRGTKEVVRIDADAVRPVTHRVRDGAVEIRDHASRVAVYFAALRPGWEARLEERRRALIAWEESFKFNPGTNPADLEILKSALAGSKQK